MVNSVVVVVGDSDVRRDVDVVVLEFAETKNGEVNDDRTESNVAVMNANIRRGRIIL